MNPSILAWASLAFGVPALLVYFGVLATRPRIARMVNGSGLFLNGLGLVEVFFWLRQTSGPAPFNAVLAVAALCCAALAQAVVVLRNSRSWDGVERRATSADGQAR